MSAPSYPRRSFRGIWIPAELWLERRISALGRILVAEIDSLSSAPRGCWASNGYLAELLGVSERQLQRLLAEVEEAGWITREMVEDRQAVGGHWRFLRVVRPDHGAAIPAGDGGGDTASVGDPQGGESVGARGDNSATPPLARPSSPHGEHSGPLRGEHRKAAAAVPDSKDMTDQSAPRLPAAAPEEIAPTGDSGPVVGPFAPSARRLPAAPGEILPNGKGPASISPPGLSAPRLPAADLTGSSERNGARSPAPSGLPAAALPAAGGGTEMAAPMPSLGAILATMAPDANGGPRAGETAPPAEMTGKSPDSPIVPSPIPQPTPGTRPGPEADARAAEIARAETLLAEADVNGGTEAELARSHRLGRVEAVLRRAAREEKGGGWIVKALRLGWAGDPEPQEEPPNEEHRAQAEIAATRQLLQEQRAVAAEGTSRSREDQQALAAVELTEFQAVLARFPELAGRSAARCKLAALQAAAGHAP